MDVKKNNVVANDRFADFIGLKLLKYDSGYALAQLEIEERHLNGVGLAQGGVLFTLADYAFAAACNADGIPTVGINCSISYIKTAKGKIITAEAKEVSTQNRLCQYMVCIYDEDKTLLAQMMCTGYMKR